jgi:glycosyltransferase involved in cell wall biosynthesis
VLPAEEDFGIVPVEALACGRPVVALGRGGARETVTHGESGLLVDRETPEAFAEAMAEIGRRTFDLSALRGRAETFGRERFESQFAALVEGALARRSAAGAEAAHRAC